MTFKVVLVWAVRVAFINNLKFSWHNHNHHNTSWNPTRIKRGVTYKDNKKNKEWLLFVLCVTVPLRNIIREVWSSLHSMPFVLCLPFDDVVFVPCWFISTGCSCCSSCWIRHGQWRVHTLSWQNESPCRSRYVQAPLSRSGVARFSFSPLTLVLSLGIALDVAY